MERIETLVQSELARYREWARDWVLPEPPPEMMARLAPLYGDHDRAWTLMALAGDEIVGVVSLSLYTASMEEEPMPGTVYLWQMFARHDWQGRGLAPALLDRGLAEARQRGFARMILWTAAGAAQARRFYEREGFRLSGREQPDSGIGLRLVEYERAL
jgi:GNAT superfamily N-acetyltransferase